MIIIYKGSTPYLPIAACQAHLGHSRYLQQTTADKLTIWGTDRKTNVVCSLVTGKYGSLYVRVIKGLAQIFGIDVMIIDMDCLIERRLNFLTRLVAKFLPGSWLFTWLYGCSYHEFLTEIIITAVRKGGGRSL